MLMPLYGNGTYHVRSTISYSLLFSPQFSQNPNKVMQLDPCTESQITYTVGHAIYDISEGWEIFYHKTGPTTWWKLMYGFKNTRNIKFYTFPPCSLMPEIPSSQLKALVLPWNANIPGNITASPFLLRQGRGMARTRTPCSQEVGCPRLLWEACPQAWGHSRQLHFLHNFPKGHECTHYQVCIVGA